LRPVDERIAALAIIGMCNWSAWWYSPDSSRPRKIIAEQMADLAVAALARGAHRAPEVNGVSGAMALLREDLDYLQRQLEQSGTAQKNETRKESAESRRQSE